MINWDRSKVNEFIGREWRVPIESGRLPGAPRTVLFEGRFAGTLLEVSRVGYQYFVTNMITKETAIVRAEDVALLIALRSGIIPEIGERLPPWKPPEGEGKGTFRVHRDEDGREVG